MSKQAGSDSAATQDGGQRGLSRRRFIILGSAGIVIAGAVGTAVLIPFLTRGEAQPEPSPADPAASKPVKVDDSKTPKASGTTGTGAAKDEATGQGAGPEAEGSAAQGTEAPGAAPVTQASPGTGSDVDTGGGSGGSPSGADPGSGGTPARVWHEGWSEWVVDVPAHSERRIVREAWDEETGHYGDACNVCGVEIIGGYMAHAKATGHTQGYTNNVWFSDGTVHHDAVYEDVWVEEQGHWASHEGYWE